MFIRTLSILIVAVSLSFFGAVIDRAYSASIDEALKTLKGLTGNERLTRVENEALEEGSVRWASSTPQAWAEPALQIFRKRYPTIKVEYMRQSGRVLAERIIREHRAGKYEIDIVGTSAVILPAVAAPVSNPISPKWSPGPRRINSISFPPTTWFSDRTPVPTINSDCRTAPGSRRTSPLSTVFCFIFAASDPRSSGVRAAKISTRSSAL